MFAALPYPLRALTNSLALGVAIALLLTLAFGQRLSASLAYSVPISLSCWLLIDGGWRLAARWVNRGAAADAPYPNWPGWRWMIVVIVLGTMLGYAMGAALGNLITGGAAPSLVIDSPRRAFATILFSLVPGVAATYHYYARGRIAATEARVEASQRQAAEARLRLLESQLEPHMLFNTLANLRVLIARDPQRAQAMLDRLIAFLRATLVASRVGRHALSDEFARLADYLALMQVRMGARLRIRLDLPEALADVPVPPLLLQPLVENAIRHGLEPRIDGGRIEIGARREGDVLVLRVRDTGAGPAASPAAGTAFGLAQVRDRLATIYGGRSSLDLVPAGDADGGMLATIRLPLQP